jgi:hypothetical protein
LSDIFSVESAARVAKERRPVAVLLLPVVLSIQLSINSATKSSYRTHALNQQFVRENTQTIDCRCFHSKDNWAERNWFTSVTSRERKFGRSEIALWANKHQDTARTMLMLARIARKNLL